MRKFISNLAEAAGLDRNPRVAVVRLTGAIGAAGGLRPGLTLAGVAGQLEEAFTMGRAQAVALIINSPGGSPVQSKLIHDRVRALSEEHGKPVFAFCEDVAASGGYMLALSADEIFADPSSIVGSIGVISAGFGFPGLLEKLGIERRVHTSGENKAMLDPFQPEDEADVKRLEAIQKDVHADFKAMVKARRGDRLKGSDGKLFTGEFWVGQKAVELGLIDGLDNLRSVMRKRFGSKVRLKVVQPARGFFGQPKPDTAAGGDIAAIWGAPGKALAWLEARSLWYRFGL